MEPLLPWKSRPKDGGGGQSHSKIKGRILDLLKVKLKFET